MKAKKISKNNSDNELPFEKMIKFPTITIVARAVFHEKKKYHWQIFLDECLYKVWKWKV